MSSKVIGLAVLAGASFMAFAAPAGASTVFSSDFETPAFPGTGFDMVNSIQGWGLSAGPDIEVQHGNVAGLSHSGVQHVELDSFGNSAMSRVVGAGDYTLSYWYSPRPNVPLISNLIEVLVDGNLIDSVALVGQSQTVWGQRVVNFSLGSPGVLEFRAGGTSDSLGGYLDDIELSTSAVPEPASWALLLAGFGLLGGTMRRRRLTVAFA